MERLFMHHSILMSYLYNSNVSFEGKKKTKLYTNVVRLKKSTFNRLVGLKMVFILEYNRDFIQGDKSRHSNDSLGFYSEAPRKEITLLRPLIFTFFQSSTAGNRFWTFNILVKSYSILFY